MYIFWWFPIKKYVTVVVSAYKLLFTNGNTVVHITNSPNDTCLIRALCRVVDKMCEWSLIWTNIYHLYNILSSGSHKKQTSVICSLLIENGVFVKSSQITLQTPESCDSSLSVFSTCAIAHVTCLPTKLLGESGQQITLALWPCDWISRLLLTLGSRTCQTTSGHIDHQMSSPVGRLAMIARLVHSLIICCHFETILRVFL